MNFFSRHDCLQSTGRKFRFVMILRKLENLLKKATASLFLFTTELLHFNIEDQ